MRTRQGIKDWLARAFHQLPHTACAAILLLSAARCPAQPPAAAEARSVEGKVQRYKTAPKGEIDGALLDNGSSLHWPPHLQDRFTNVVAEGARVRATGRTETGPEGDVHFEVDTVTNTQSNVSATNPDFGFGPPEPPWGPRGRGRRGSSTSTRVGAWTTAATPGRSAACCGDGSRRGKHGPWKSSESDNGTPRRNRWSGSGRRNIVALATAHAGSIQYRHQSGRLSPSHRANRNRPGREQAL